MDRREYARDDFGDWKSYWADEYGIAVPVRRIVCPTCDGRGCYVNPSIDADGIGREDWDDWDDDDRAGYLSGRYDVICGECHGHNVVERLSDQAPPDMRDSWSDWQRDARNMRMEVMAEQRMGA